MTVVPRSMEWNHMLVPSSRSKSAGMPAYPASAADGAVGL